MTDEALKAFILASSEEDLKGRRLVPHTQAAALKAQSDFLSWITSKGYELVKIKKKHLLEYHNLLCQTKSKKSGDFLCAATVNDRFHSVCSLFSLLYREGIIKENPSHNLDLKLPERKSIRRPLTVDEINSFLEVLDTTTSQGLRDRTLFELIYSSGLRVAEAGGLKVGDIDFDRREIVVKGKGDRERIVPISKIAKDFLVLFLGERIDKPSLWVFPGGTRGIRTGGSLRPSSISERFKVLLKRFEMDKKEISTHSIRHSTATHLLDNGASVRHVQELLGHKSIETTVRYTHVQTEGLARIYRKYHPREHELFEAMDEEYLRRFESLLGGRGKM